VNGAFILKLDLKETDILLSRFDRPAVVNTVMNLLVYKWRESFFFTNEV
jgi:hypothetical protein